MAVSVRQIAKSVGDEGGRSVRRYVTQANGNHRERLVDHQIERDGGCAHDLDPLGQLG